MVLDRLDAFKPEMLRLRAQVLPDEEQKEIKEAQKGMTEGLQ